MVSNEAHRVTTTHLCGSLERALERCDVSEEGPVPEGGLGRATPNLPITAWSWSLHIRASGWRPPCSQHTALSKLSLRMWSMVGTHHHSVSTHWVSCSEASPIPDSGDSHQLHTSSLRNSLQCV